MVSSSDIQEAIKYLVEKLGYESLKPEQEKEFLSGNDVLLPYLPAMASLTLCCACLFVCLMLLTG